MVPRGSLDSRAISLGAGCLVALSTWLALSLLASAPLVLSSYSSCPDSCAPAASSEVERTTCLFSCKECSTGSQLALPGYFVPTFDGAKAVRFSCWATPSSVLLFVFLSGLALLLALLGVGLGVLLRPIRPQELEDSLKQHLCASCK